MCEYVKRNELKQFIEEAQQKDHSDSFLISVLHKVQELYGYLSRENLEYVSIHMKIPAAHIWGVATFYHYFKLAPSGKHTISICMGTACYVKGAPLVFEAIKNKLGINIGETTSDGLFTFTETRCLGACALAPLVMIDNKIYGKMTSAKIIKLLKNIMKKDTSKAS